VENAFFFAHALHYCKWGFASEFAVTILTVVAIFKIMGLLNEIRLRENGNLAKKPFIIVVIKFFNHAISPGLLYWDKPQMNVEMQTQANQRTHSSWMSRAAVKTHLIIYLQLRWYAHALPQGPKPINNSLSGAGKQWFYAASAGAQIYHIQAVKPDRPFEIAWADKVSLMYLVGVLCGQYGICSALGLISPGTTVG
jgi:hypothetical protein